MGVRIFLGNQVSHVVDIGVMNELQVNIVFDYLIQILLRLLKVSNATIKLRQRHVGLYFLADEGTDLFF